MAKAQKQKKKVKGFMVRLSRHDHATLTKLAARNGRTLASETSRALQKHFQDCLEVAGNRPEGVQS